MPIFYHVDRKNHLHEGQVLNLIHPTIQPPPEIPDLVEFGKKMFPDGVSQHGDQYFYRASRTDHKEPGIEALLEYYRRAYFPNKPSRFQSCFGVESLDAAYHFQNKFGQGMGVIWEVETDDYFKADMNLLSPYTVLVCSYFANVYWSGQPAPHISPPFWEVLLVPPVKVLRKVEYSAFVVD